MFDLLNMSNRSKRLETTAYDAFISYKHAASSAFAADLELHLKRYARGRLARPRRIFRDEQHLHLGGDLPAMIREALERSRYLILLASPQAAAAPWVCEELDIWCRQLGRTSDLLIILTNGHIAVTENGTAIDWPVTTALPKSLKSQINGLPLWSDLSSTRQPQQRALENPEYKSAINAIVARLEGKEPNTLLGEEWRLRKRDTRFAIGTIVTLATMLFVIVSALVLLEIRNTELTKALAVSRSRELAASSRLEHAPEALTLARHAVESDVSPEAVRALTDAMARYRALRAHLAQAPDAIETMVISPDDRSLLYALPVHGRIGRVSTNGEPRADIVLPGAQTVVGMVTHGQTIYAWSFDAIWRIDAATDASKKIPLNEVEGGGLLTALAVDAPHRLILGWSDGTVSWQSLTNGDTGVLYRHPGAITDLAVTAQTILSTATAGDSSVAVLRPGAVEPVFIANTPGAANDLAISADGTRFTVAFEFPWVGVWSLSNLKRQWIDQLNETASAVTFWPATGHGVAAGDLDGNVTIFDMRGDVDDRIDASAAAIFELVAGQERLFSAGSDGWVRSWRPSVPGPLSEALPPADHLFWFDGALWGVQETGGWMMVETIKTPVPHNFGRIEAARAGSVVSFENEVVQVTVIGANHMVTKRKFPEALPAHRARTVAISDDGTMIAIAWWPRNWSEESARVSVWNLTSDSVIWLPLPLDAPKALAFGQSRQLAAMDDDQLAVWDLASRGLIAGMPQAVGTDPVNTIVFSEDGRLVLGGLDGFVALHDLANPGVVLARNPGRGSAISHLSVVDGAIFAVDQTGVRRFNETLIYLGPVVYTGSLQIGVRSTAPHPSGKVLAVALQGGSAITFHSTRKTGHLLLQRAQHQSHSVE
ncbi:MAG: TIR domain-containing protein [Roseibium sp.]